MMTDWFAFGPSAGRRVLVNDRTGRPVATDVTIAATRRLRRRGLLGRERMDSEAALVLTPCRAIHTMWMRFSIDVIFLEPDGRVVRVLRALRPWRVAASIRARSVVELAEGAVPDDVLIGDRLYLV